MRLPIAGKIITLVVVAVALSCTAVLLTTMRLLEPPLDASIDATTQLAKATTDATYNASSEKFLQEARLIAGNPALVEAVARRDHAAAAALGAERPPTIFVIKGGEVKASKVGLMNPREMAAFFEKA